ncbi:MAG: hypothetical protein ACT4QD_04580, partial [Acidobacteriota bacterium]
MKIARIALVVAGLVAGVPAWAQPPSDPGPQTGPISGYMELHLNKPVADPAPAVLDFHRFVL